MPSQVSIRTNFIQWLLSQSLVTAAVGQRVWPQLRPGGSGDVLPCLVVTKKPNGDHPHTLAGTTNVRRHVFHIACIGELYEDADNLFVILAGQPSASAGLLSGVAGVTMNGQMCSEVAVMDDWDGAEDIELFANKKAAVITIEVHITTTTGQ